MVEFTRGQKEKSETVLTDCLPECTVNDFVPITVSKISSFAVIMNLHHCMITVETNFKLKHVGPVFGSPFGMP